MAADPFPAMPGTPLPDASPVFQCLLETSNLVGSVMELDEILARVSEIGSRAMNAQVCSIYLLNESRDRLVLRATHGLNKALVGKASLAVNESIQGWVVRENTTAAVRNCTQDSRWRPLEGSGEEEYVSLICAPLRIQEEVVGVMSARRRTEHIWTPDETLIFETISKQVAIVIEKSRLYFKKVEAERLAAIAVSLSEIAHYIKNLLQGMQGGQFFVDSGLKRGDIERARQGWEMLHKNVNKIGNLVQNMLNFSRSSKLHIEPENLNGLLYELASSVEETASQRGVTFRVVLDDTIPELPLAYDALHEALLNLLTNAMDAIPEGQSGTVELHSRLDLSAGVARVTVSDSGVGISPENLPRIFTLFFSTKGRRGTGIGLAVTKKIIEEHGGRIRLESEVGKGTTFTVELPLVAVV